MKKMAVILMLVISGIVFSCPQKVKREVPEVVKKAFQRQYSSENDPDWHVDDHGNFEANFKVDGKKYRADYNPDGSWIETERSIDKKDLPKAVRDKIEKDFYLNEISEIEEVHHHSKGIFYDVEFKRKGKNKDVEFRANGEIIH